MSVRALSAKMKRRAPAGAAPAINADAAAEIERAKRQQLLSAKDAEKARADLVKAQAETAAALADARKVRVQAAVTSAASKARALNPAQVASLLSGSVEDRDGKLVVKGADGADVDVDTYVPAWLASDGKHFLPASVPGGGSGAPATPNGAKPAAAHDLTTNKGLTDYARERDAGAFRSRFPGDRPAPKTSQQQ